MANAPVAHPPAENPFDTAIAREIDEWITKATKFIDVTFPAFGKHFLSDAGF
jgi:hypothetical protein